jgi:predicted transcriptional regulator
MDSIQLLTRRGATCSDLLSCLYNLKPIDLEVFLEVAKNENATLDQIAQLVQRDRSSTHRCLSKLVSAGLVHKQAETLKGGGYCHIYSIVEPFKIKEHARQRVKEITESLESLIENFESDLKKHLGTKLLSENSSKQQY